MFTGIIETLGEVASIEKDAENCVLEIKSKLTPELKIDQSVAHNGVCLTVIELLEHSYKVVAIKETLEKTNVNTLREAALVNLERCLKVGDRLDGHFVQGHVDQVVSCSKVEDQQGSWMFTFTHSSLLNEYIVEKGSITLNGVSLTLVNVSNNQFSVAIIPYTFEHTSFKTVKVGDLVNVEYDVLGKYIVKKMGERES